LNAEIIGYVLASNYRKKVLLALEEKQLTPMMISQKTKIYATHVSTTLSELGEKRLVVCLNPKAKKGRIYDLTKEGRNILKNL
jgi:predicted transcriptional regulator